MIVAVIIPCYKVAGQIKEVISSLPPMVNYIIAVNDFSPDLTGEILRECACGDKRIIYLEHMQNKGVGGAMLTGFKKALEIDADIIIKIDGDGQMDCSYLEPLIHPLVTGKADFSKGNRFRDFSALKNMPAIRRLGNLGLSFCIKAASGYWNIFDPTNGFIAIHKNTLQHLNLSKLHSRYFFETSLLIELYYTGAVVSEIPMKAKYGSEVSGLSVSRALFEFPPKLFYAFLRRVVIKYFLFDFNIASLYLLFGIPLFLFGTVYGLINFIKYAGSHVPAPTGTVVIPTLLIILGFQLLLSAVQYDVANFPQKSK
jgi:dolichol-phosphate mannosyltransferase